MKIIWLVMVSGGISCVMLVRIRVLKMSDCLVVSEVVNAMYAVVACAVWRVLWCSAVEHERVEVVCWRFLNGLMLRAVDV